MTVLLLSAIPAALAAGFDSVGLGLLALAGLVWAAALYVCSVAPVVTGHRVTVTEAVATALSTVGGIVAVLGVLLILVAAF